MDKQRKIVLSIAVAVVVALGLAVYFGSTVESDRNTKKTTNQNQAAAENVADPGFTARRNSESILINNTEDGFKLALPGDWQVSEHAFSNLLVFYSADVDINDDTATELAQGMKVDVHSEPADQDMTLAENMAMFFTNVEKYEEIDVNGIQAAVAENEDFGYSKNTYIFDDLNGLMVIVSGFGQSGEEFDRIYDGIVSSFEFTR